MKQKTAIFLVTIFFAGLLNFCLSEAMAAPTAKMVKEVVDYFYNGQTEGPILTDSNLCKSVKALDCEESIDMNAISLGESIKVWMNFFVPKGAVYDDIIVEYKHEGIPRNLTSHKVEGSIRYRVVDTYKLDKLGKWTISIKKGMTNLKEYNVTVVKK